MSLYGRFSQVYSALELRALQQFSGVSSRFGQAGELVGPCSEQDQAAGPGVELLQPSTGITAFGLPPASTTTGPCMARKPTSAAS